MQRDVSILRELSKQVSEIANKPIQEERRNLWRKHNSFMRIRPLINVRAFAFSEIIDRNTMKCEDPLLRSYEYYMHLMKFRDTIGYDFIIEPWLTVDSIYDPTIDNRWGVRVGLGEKIHHGGAASYKPELLDEVDIERLIVPRHKINEEATNERFEKLQSAVGDIMEIHVDRGPMLSFWTGDISTDLAQMRGLEQIMWDVYDRPEWFHKLLKFMRDGILKVHEEAENANDFSLLNHQNQAMTYAEELKDPMPNTYGRKRKELWWYMASQEFTSFGPDMFDEFMLQYQIPILEKFGLVSYGCCEDLTQKIDCLRKIPNLRRIAVTPFANTKKCAEQIGKDYILSWRPNPATMTSTGLDEDFVRKHMRENFKAFKENDNHFDITLKDVETINHQTQNVSKWVRIVREEIEKAF